jgi:hypothetical protein
MRHITAAPPTSHPRREPPVLAIGATAMAFLFALSALALAGLTACGSSGAIPADAQLVRVTVTQSEVRLEPASVRAGDVYMVLEGPIPAAAIVGREREDATGAGMAFTPGPLNDADLARLERGDSQFTATGMMEVSCNPEQQEAMRGRQGQCGNVFKIDVVPGSYAIVHGGCGGYQPDCPEEPRTTPAGGPIMAVLRVEP